MNFLKKFFLVLLITVLIVGCSSKEEQPFSKSEANQKLVQILENDYGINAIIASTGNTLWIYLPSENPLYKITGSKKSSNSTQKKYTLQYVNSVFHDNIFTLEYDIVPTTKLSQGSGMSTKYAPEFNAQYRNVTSAISRTFFNSKNPPEFIVLVIADIKNGLETQTVFYTLDLKKYFSQALPPDEYALRAKTESLGDEAIKGDEKGAHLQIKEILMPKFLADQIKNRITFKFQSSDFPPDKNIEDEILDAVAKTIHAYNFNDFNKVILKDLRAGNEKNFSKNQMKSLRETLPKEKSAEDGRIITIDFSDLISQQNNQKLL